MSTKRKKSRGNPAVSFRSQRMWRSTISAFDLVRDLEGYLSTHNHIVLQGSALALMNIVDPDGTRTMEKRPKAEYNHAHLTKRIFDVMKTCVELTKNPDDLSDEQFLSLRSAACGLMFTYSELSGLPDPVSVVFKDMVKEESDKAWSNKPENQNKLLRRKIDVKEEPQMAS